MSEEEKSQLSAIQRLIGKWMIGIFVSIFVSGLGAGAWMTNLNGQLTKLNNSVATLVKQDEELEQRDEKTSEELADLTAVVLSRANFLTVNHWDIIVEFYVENERLPKRWEVLKIEEERSP